MVETSQWLLCGTDPAPTARVGGKGAGLYQLQSLGLKVPHFLVLTADAFHDCCPQGVVPQAASSDLQTILTQAWQQLGSGQTPLAVRSSAIDEDGAEASYAGQMETFLNITTPERLTLAVLDCWRSLYSPRVTAYRAQKQMNAATPPAMAVVIQHMVQPDSAGVLFTVNPINQHPDEVLISAVWGLGEGLVSGSLDADTFVLHRDGRVLSSQIATKTEQVISQANGGIQTVAVPTHQQTEPCLTPNQLQTLLAQSCQAELSAGYPLDMEFAVCGDQLYCLQARPITSLTHTLPVPDTQRWVWDNSNINESYPGITQSLTFSFIRKAYYCVYWQFLEVLGLPTNTIRQHEPMLSNMLGLIQGRVYYNLLNWYRLVALMPGFEFNKPFMEGMMGLQTPEDVAPAPVGWWQKYIIEFPKLLGVGVRMIGLQWTLAARIAQFHQAFNRVYQQLNSLDFNAMPPSQALGYFEVLEKDVLWQWKAPIINDFSAMIYYGLLKKVTVQWQVDSDGSLQNALVSGQGDIESTQVMTQLLAVAQAIAADESFKSSFLEVPAKAALKELMAHATLGQQFQAYLDRYGDRCVAELKLESIPMKEDPTFAVAMLQNYVRHGYGNITTSKHDDTGLRRDAERDLRKRLGGVLLPKYWAYRWILFRARAAIRNRENQRLARTRAFALVRRIFQSIGQWFVQQGVLANARDIFDLEVEEIRGFIHGTTPNTDLRALVAQRQATYRQFESMPPLPDHFETHGPVNTDTSVKALTRPNPNNWPGNGTLTGLGACPGVVEKPAVVLFDPNPQTALSGEILVTRQTDPGWVVLFPAISGLVVERGSMLSHSAIVAREMGIPTVVGVQGATQHIQTGMTIRLDGAQGTVALLDAPP
jgi:phosphohistidine swiveling domain-containing protein